MRIPRNQDSGVVVVYVVVVVVVVVVVYVAVVVVYLINRINKSIITFNI